MEMLEGNSLCSYLKQAKMLFFYFTKLENRRAQQVLSGGVGTSGREEEVEKGWRSMNMVQYRVHMEMEKLDLLKLFQE
jgi:hypothetical protein